MKIQLIALVYGIASNLVHPVTPTLVKQLALPEYMTGVLYAAMSLGMFLFGTFWGRMADKRGRKPVLVITFFGYALAQLGFCYAQDALTLTLARFVSGCFTGGTMVALMALVIDASTERERARRLSYYAAMISASSSLGAFLGGALGMVSLQLAFWSQSLGLALGALLSFLWAQEPAVSAAAAKVTPKLNFGVLKSMMPMATVLFLVGVVLSNFGTVGMDNALANYLRFALDYPSSVNGALKAASGVLGLLVNTLVNPWILRRMVPNRALMWSLLLCALTLLLLSLVSNVPAFMVLNILFFVFNAMYIPIQQTIISEDKQVDFGLMSGLFYTVRSVGQIAGSLSAGFLYMVHPKLPFASQSIGFFLAVASCIWVIRLRMKRGEG